ncbi:MAG: c-type cytochrome biogenesis protein CcmI [Hyphomicrobiales bacterium]|nr:c-type cytochrome biogenesis protein CcmI [Hyphomicrobiales bacterium]
MILWLILASLTAAIVIVIVAPLYRNARSENVAANEVELYKAQLQEIDEDLRRNVISEDEARDVSREISRRILAASDENHRSKNGASPKLLRPNWAAGAVAIAITVLSLLVYLLTGAPQMPGQPLAARLESPDESNKIEPMIAKVEARLRTNPEDGAGWNVIAPVYMRVQRFEDAADAFRKAMALTGETPDRLAGYGEASIAANDGVATALARSALQKALKQRPDLLRARFFLAVADENQGDKSAARAGYETLLKSSLAPDWRKAVEAKIAALDGKTLPNTQTPGDVAARQQMIEGMVAGLADRLGKNGGEVDEWLRLVRAYSVLGKKGDAIATVEKARSQYAGNLDALKQINDFASAMGLNS